MKSLIARLAADLRRRGFDQSKCVGKRVRVSCSQCQSTVINGMPVHERGCPNEKKNEEDRKRA